MMHVRGYDLARVLEHDRTSKRSSARHQSYDKGIMVVARSRTDWTGRECGTGRPWDR